MAVGVDLRRVPYRLMWWNDVIGRSAKPERPPFLKQHVTFDGNDAVYMPMIEVVGRKVKRD